MALKELLGRPVSSLRFCTEDDYQGQVDAPMKFEPAGGMPSRAGDGIEAEWVGPHGLALGIMRAF